MGQFSHGAPHPDGAPPPYHHNVAPPAYSNAAMVLHQTVTSTGPDGTHPTTVLASGGTPPPGAVDDYRPALTQGRRRGRVRVVLLWHRGSVCAGEQGKQIEHVK